MNEGEENGTIEAGAAGAPEGAVGAEPTTDEIAELYKATGVKAPVPTGKAKGRPKTSNVRDEDDGKNPTGDSDSGSKGKKTGDDDDKGKSKNASTPSKDGDSGDDSDSKGKKVGEDSTEVSDKSKEASSGVRDSKSEGEDDSERGGEDGAGDGTERTGQEEHNEDGTPKTPSDDEKDIKRPGKSNPEVEKRFQKITEEKRAAEQRAAELEKRLEEKERAEQQSKVAQEDPEYTIEDFRKVQDSEGNIIELDKNQAELAWRRWKDGFDQRAEERQAAANHEETMAKQREEHAEKLMKASVEAYDTLANLQTEYPELVTTSGSYDPEFAADALPIIQESILYLEGTEPGSKDENGEDVLPVIIGVKFHPKKMLDALKNANNKKRTLPLNGVNDNVETGTQVNVQHSRSSDPTVQAANDLYKDLGIKKRL